MLRTLAIFVMAGCVADSVELPPREGELVERYVEAMCFDDFKSAQMGAAWATTKMYPHEGAYCGGCHGRGESGFVAPDLSVADAVKRERNFFVDLKSLRPYLLDYVTPVFMVDGTPTMEVNRASFETVAAGGYGHERFALYDEPGMPALIQFHQLTMQRMASGAACSE